MALPATFVPTTPLQPSTASTALRTHAVTRRSPHAVTTRSRNGRAVLRATASPAPNKPVIQVGEIVAVRRGSSARPVIARVTGAAASGETVDLQLLEAFVKELYVDSKEPPTFEKASDIKKIRHEFVPSQNGWIVLDQDLEEATQHFANRPLDLSIKSSVIVEDEPKEPLSDSALKRQFFQPTIGQAFFGGVLCFPLSAILFSAFASARDTYAANPAGGDMLNAQFFRSFVLVVSGGGSVASIFVGCALLLYAQRKSKQS